MSEHICQKCGDDMTIPFDMEPTDYCNTCAQDLVVEMKEELEQVKKQFISRESVKPLVEALRATTSQVCSSDPWHQKVAAEKTGQEALEHARTLGL